MCFFFFNLPSPSLPHQQHHRVHRHAPPLPQRVHLFMRLGFHVDDARVHPAQQGRQIGPDGILVRRQLGALQDDSHVDVAQPVPIGGHEADGFAQEDVRGGPLPLGVGVREELADVRAGEGAQDGVGDRVEEGVPVRVGDAPAVVRDGDAAQDEFQVGPLLQAVQVKAVADPEGEGGGGGGGGGGAAEVGGWGGGKRVRVGEAGGPPNLPRPCRDAPPPFSLFSVRPSSPISLVPGPRGAGRGLCIVG